jgi:hypothetical protein
MDEFRFSYTTLLVSARKGEDSAQLGLEGVLVKRPCELGSSFAVALLQRLFEDAVNGWNDRLRCQRRQPIPHFRLRRL